MSNYKQLIQKIFDSNDTSTIDSIKKLIYLSVNDSQNFSPYCAKIAKLISQSLHNPIEDDEVKKLFLQLLSQIATNYFQHIPASFYNFMGLINMLSDQNAQVRKASHYLLLIFIKKYQKIDQVLDNYVKIIQSNPDHWKVIQKIIHSFQSLLVIQPKCITYGKNFESMDEFLRMLLAFRAHHHHLIQKASDQQTVTSFVKNEYAPQVLPKLDTKLMQQLISYASKLNIKLSINKQNFTNLHVEEDNDEQELEEIKISNNAFKKSKKRLCFEDNIKKIQGEGDWKSKLDAVEEISNQLGNCSQADIPEDMIDKILDLTYDYNFKTCITAMNIVWTLVSKYPNSIYPKRQKTEDIIIEKICDLKMAVRQIAAKIIKKLYDSSSKSLTKKILSKLQSCSIVGKQQILSFLQQNYKSSNESIDLATILSDVSSQLMNQNTRIKIKTIDCLVKLSVSNNLQECKYILQKKLNKVYFDMFLERLKQKIGTQTNQMIQQNDKNYNKGNMTWQAQRTSSPIQPVDKQSLTKVEFGTRKQQKLQMIDTIEDFSYDTSQKKLESFNEKKSTSTLKNKTANTFDTFQSQQTSSNNYKLVKKNNSSSVKQGNSFMSEQQKIQQKRAPLKPNPIKKKPNEPVKQQKQDNLVIQSKQYIDKTLQQQTVMSTNTNNTSKYSMTRQSKPESIPRKEPFSIKKSTSITKKQPHQIDYKATYYATKQELSQLDNPLQAIKQIIKCLPNDNDWNKQFDGLNLCRRFIKNHEDMFGTFYENLPAIMPQVLKLVQSLRSSLSKNAMITLAQMCQALKKAMDPFLQSIFVKLFKKSQDTNTFIVQEVKKCMSSLCMYCTSAKITSIIVTASQTKSIPVKLKVALCVDKLLEKKEYNLEALKQNPKLVGIMSAMISDGSAQVRNLIKESFEIVCKNNQKKYVQEMFKKNSQKDSWEKFKKILDKESKFTDF